MHNRSPNNFNISDIIDNAGNMRCPAGPADTAVTATVASGTALLLTPSSGKKFRMTGFALFASADLALKIGTRTVGTIPAGQLTQCWIGTSGALGANDETITVAGTNGTTVRGVFFGAEE